MNHKAFEKPKPKRTYWKTIKLYVVPIITIVIFFFIMIGLTLPRVLHIIDLNGSISEVNTEIETNKAELDKLRVLSQNLDEVSNYLSVIRSIAPVGITDVVGFRDKITSIMRSNRLEISTQRLSESDIQAEGEENDFFLREVPFVFDVIGDFENIVAFIKELNTVDEFIVVKQMELTQNKDSEKWTLLINIVKYQFTEELNSESVQQLFQNISATSEISVEIKKFLERRME